jgi:hypothetical protein
VLSVLFLLSIVLSVLFLLSIVLFVFFFYSFSAIENWIWIEPRKRSHVLKDHFFFVLKVTS